MIISKRNLKRKKIGFSRRATSWLKRLKSVKRKTKRSGKDLLSLRIV